VGIHDRFFALGGHSLQAVQVASRLGEMFHIQLPLGAVLESPTAAELALDVVRALVDQSADADVEEALALAEVES
jgi:acyl carrier protein